MAGCRSKNILEDTSNLQMTDWGQLFADAFSRMKGPFFQKNITGLGGIAQSGINGYNKWLLMPFFNFTACILKIQGMDGSVQGAVDVRRNGGAGSGDNRQYRTDDRTETVAKNGRGANTNKHKGTIFFIILPEHGGQTI